MARRFLDEQVARQPNTARRTKAGLQVLIDPLSGWARLPDGELLPAPCDFTGSPTRWRF